GEFGVALREGIATDFENREKIAARLRFASSHAAGPDALVSLDDYLGRMREGQKQIYFLGGPDRTAIEGSPNLEVFRRRNLEVLFLPDPIDEFVLSTLHAYKDKPLVSIDSADVELPEATEKDAEAAEPESGKSEPTPSGFGRVLTLFREALREQVEDVRESQRLTDSPCCLVNPKGAASTQMQKLLHATHQDFPLAKRIFEVNPRHPLVRRLAELSANADHEPFIAECGRQLFANALILEGLPLDTGEATGRVERFMQELAQKRSPIVT
ncbi:MAG TPA: molecular chaperone HtpG, partial [Planctomycetaceae bacterium]|nr:molecular chaperone HtpG [Planctomycetaceae bacterium]